MVGRIKTFIDIEGRDRTGSAFSGVTGKLDKLGRSTERIGGKVNALLSGAIAGFTTAGIGLAVDGIGQVVGSLGTAIDREQELIAATSSFAVIAETDFATATESIGRVTDELGKTAAALPGVTSDYTRLANSIFDNVIPAARGLDGSIDFTKMEGDVLSLSESFGALGATAGIAAQDVSKGLSKALSGKSLSELGELQLFEANPALLSEIEKQLSARNVETLKDLNVSARVGLIRDVGERFISEDFKNATSQSVGGLVESFKTALLDPRQGVFGVARDLFSDEGDQSVYTAFRDLLGNVIGPGGLLAGDGPAAELLGALGIDLPDPMRFIYNQLQRAIAFLDRTKNFVTSITDNLEDGLGLSGAIANLFGSGGELSGDAIARSIGEGAGNLNRMFYKTINDGVASMDSAQISDRIGVAITKSGSFIGNLLFELIRNAPWGEIARFMGTVPAFVASTILDGIQKGLMGLGEKLGEAVRNAASQAIGRALGAARSVIPPQRPISQSSGRRSTSVQRGAEGFTPQTQANILAQAMAEYKAAPSGAGLVIANDTERIIPQGQPGNGAPLSPTTRQNITVNFSPTLTLAPGSTQAQARELLAMVQQMLTQQAEAQLV